MLSSLDRKDAAQRISRYANALRIAQLAASRHLSLDEVSEVAAFQREDILQEVLTSPFKRKPALGNRFATETRYSTGDWPVFYGAIDDETAAAETAHYASDAALADRSTMVTYSRVQCLLRGPCIDLRSQSWPDLTAEDYKFCQSLGEEAHNTDLAGLFAPSARLDNGTTVPTFRSDVLSEPTLEGVVRITIDGTSLRVESKDT